MQLNKIDAESLDTDMGRSFRVLIVEDDQDVKEALNDVILLEFPNLEILGASDVDEALALQKEQRFDLALIDIRLSHSNGLDLIRPLKEVHPDIACIMMTAFRESEYTVVALRNGADDYLFKPIEPVKLISVIQRFFRRTALEQQKKELESRFKVVFEQSFQLLFLLDSRGNIRDANRAALRALRRNGSELEGQNIFELFSWGNTPQWRACSDDALTNILANKPFYFQYIHSLGSRRSLYFDVSARPVAISERETLIFLECRDITIQQRTHRLLLDARRDLESRVELRTRELKVAKQLAEQANLAKTRFLSQMSHEFRTPLNAILGFGQLLEEDDELRLTDTQSDYLSEISRAGSNLLELVDTLLDMVEIESGSLAMGETTSVVDNCINAAIDQVMPEILSRHITLSQEYEQEIMTVYADEKRLTQVIKSLVSNAVKFNRVEGSVEVKVSSRAGHRVRISVSDTGVGIPQSEQHRVFTPFERLDSTKFVDGVGVSLTLVERIVSLMGGEVGFESTEGKGSCFWVDLNTPV